jgi:dihydrolipoamide dehydrogenase
VKVALVNDSAMPGGECLWRGCIPSKAWRKAADRLRDRSDDARLGIEGTRAGWLDWDVLEAERARILSERGKLALSADKALKIDVIQGWGSFRDAHTLLVDAGRNADDPHHRAGPGDGLGTASPGDVRTIRFGCAVIATGAPPFVPPIPGTGDGLRDGAVLTSDTVWSLPERPRRVAIVGAGAIGCEMAQIFADFGSDVTLLEAQDRVLAEVEAEVARELGAVLAADPRITLAVSVRVTSIVGPPGAVVVRYAAADGEHEITCDRVLMATGKRPQFAGLGLDALGVATERGAITVDAQGRTILPHVFAVGDVVPGLMLAHTAAQQGRVAAAAILGHGDRYDEALDCGVIFTRPQAAFVGLSTSQAKSRGIDAVEVKVALRIDAQAMIAGEEHGLVKLVADAKSQRVVGVHLLADHADALVGAGVLMVSGGMTLSQVGAAIFPHPTQTELFGELARRLLARLRRSK